MTPAIITSVLLVVALIALGAFSTRYRGFWTEQGAWLGAVAAFVTIIALPIIFLGGLLAWHQINDYLLRPDVRLELFDPQEVTIGVVNVSDRIVRQPKYQVGLLDLDTGGSSARYNFLPIPVAVGDFIRPRQGWGPTQMMGTPTVQASVKKGDHIFGYAAVTCPDCIGEHSYWIYIEQGAGGWYAPAEVSFKQLADVMNRSDRLAAIDALVPVPQRIPIRDREHSR